MSRAPDRAGEDAKTTADRRLGPGPARAPGPLRALFADTFKHYVVYGLGLAASKLATIILIPIYTHAFSVEQYGVFAILSLTPTLITTLAQLGVTSAVIRSYFDYQDARSRTRVVGTGLLLVCVSTGSFAALIGLISRPLSRVLTGSPEYAVCFWLLGAALVTDSIFGLYTVLLRAEKRSFAYGAASLAKLAATCLLGVLFVAVLRRGVVGAISAIALSSAIMCLAVIPPLLRQASFHISRVEARQLLSFGIPLVPMGISAAVLASADRYFLINMSGSIELGKALVGVYSLLYMYSTLFRLAVIEPLSMIWLPQMLEVRHAAHANAFYSRMFTAYMIFSGFLVYCLTAAYPHVILIVSGRSYVGSPFVLWLILVSLICVGATRLLGVGITLARKTKYSALIYVAAALVNLALNFALIPRHGMLGAAVATVVGAGLLPIGYYWAGQRYHKVAYQWSAIARTVAIFAGLSACYFALPSLGVTGGGKGLAEVALAAIYFPLAVALGALKPAEVRAVLGELKLTGPRAALPDED